MSEITEITQKLHDPDNLKGDLSAAVGLTAQYFRQKYIAPINELYNKRCKDYISHPSPQMTLLQACKPFVSDTAVIDRLINGMSGYSAMAGILQDMSAANKKKPVSAAAADDPSIHADGVYDIDNDCVKTADITSGGNNTAALLLLALLVGLSDRQL